MRSRPEIYQAKAEMCRQGAARAKNSFERDRWLKLVTQWSEMAESAKQAHLDDVRAGPQRRAGDLIDLRSTRHCDLRLEHRPARLGAGEVRALLEP
jgi:hypothetical protein